MNSAIFLLLFHLACLGINLHHWLVLAPFPTNVNVITGTNNNNHNNPNNPFNQDARSYMPYTQFLTMWGMFGHTLYFLLCTLGDMKNVYQQHLMTAQLDGSGGSGSSGSSGSGSGSNSRSSLAQQKNQQNTHLDTFFRAFSFPLAAIVAVLFWGIYFVDRELIYPTSFEKYNPPYINHIQHTFPLISVLVDMMLVDHSYNIKTLRLDLAMIGSVSLAYMGMLFYVKFTQGVWVYPFIGLMNNTTKAIFFAVSVLLSWAFYFGGKVMSSWLWQKTKKAIKAA